MIDLTNLDGEPRHVATASLNNLEEGLKTYVVHVQEAEKYVKNAAMDEIIAVNPDADPATEYEDSAEAKLFAHLKSEAVVQLGRIRALRQRVDTYDGYAD